jgi:hypothetical protein
VDVCGDAESFCSVWFQKRTERRSEEGMQKFHWYRTGSSCLDSDSEEDSEMDLGSQATGGSASALDGDNDDDLLFCHFDRGNEQGTHVTFGYYVIFM